MKKADKAQGLIDFMARQSVHNIKQAITIKHVSLLIEEFFYLSFKLRCEFPVVGGGWDIHSAFAFP